MVDDDDTINSFSDNPFNSFQRANSAPSSFTGTDFKFLRALRSGVSPCIDGNGGKEDTEESFSDDELITIFTDDDDPIFFVDRKLDWNRDKHDHDPQSAKVLAP